jgi:alcohol dehydrogenase YqhD (iron-dependent ADH family)
MEVAKKSIEMLKDFLFGTLGLSSTLTEIGIDDTNFEIMAKKSVTGGTMYAFQPLAANDIEEIFRMCL